MGKKSLHYVVCIIVITLLFSCKKTEQMEVTGNTAPPDRTISNVTIETYVNKVYIAVLGRKADSKEFSQGLDLLKNNKLSNASRQAFLDTIYKKSHYKTQVYNVIRTDILNNLDTTEIGQRIAVFNFFLGDTVYKYAWDALKTENRRLDSLRVIPLRYDKSTINITELYKRCVDNYFYDQINMGTANFVISMFQYFLNRYPTEQELADASQMVDGNNAIVFGKNGNSKKDFLAIFFGSTGYYEGQVVNLYKRFLFRQPTTVEMASGTSQYQMDNNYETLQKTILSGNEYIGIK